MLEEAKRVTEWLRANPDEDSQEKVERACFASVCIGVIRDDPDDDYGTVDNVALGMALSEEARLLNKPTMWAQDFDSEMVYFFVGTEDEILEKLK